MLGPDLIDLRLVEITAEKTAQGLVEKREEGLVKPTMIPAPQPEVGPLRRGPTPEARAPAATKAPSKLDLIRAKAKNVAEPDPSTAAALEPGADAAAVPIPVKDTGKPAAKPGKKIKTAEAKPSLLVWLGTTPSIRSWPSGSVTSSAPARRRSSRVPS